MSFISLLRTRLFWKHLVLAVGTALLFLWGCFAFLGIFTRHGEEVKVPDFRDVYMDDVKTFAEKYDLQHEVVNTVFDRNKPKGVVVDQDPDSGSMVKRNRTIYLTVNSMRTEEVAMPNLVDLSLRQATSLLQAYGLELGNLRYVEGLPPVIDQLYKGRHIAPGSRVPKGSPIDLVLGRGSGAGLIPVPDLFGLTLMEARTVLSESRLRLENWTADAAGTDTVRALVYRQDPPVDSPEGLYAGAGVRVWITGSKSVMEDERNKPEKIE